MKLELLARDGNAANDNDDRTHEWWVLFEHNDAWMWDWLWPGNEDGVLNPSFLSPFKSRQFYIFSPIKVDTSMKCHSNLLSL